MSAHAKLAPSSAFRRVECPGSRALEARQPDRSSAASEEGTLAHEVVECYLLNKEVPQSDAVTQEMHYGAELMKELVNGIALEKLHIEEKTDISTIHPDCFGTPDLWYVEGITLHLIDYKFGRRPVEVFENWQLIEYAAGIVNDSIERVDFTIVQPRAPHAEGVIRNWEVSTKSLSRYFDTLREQESLAAQDVAPTKAGGHCRDCKARFICNTLRSAAYRIADREAENRHHDLSPLEVGVELQFLKEESKILEARISALEEHALFALKRGDSIPFLKLTQTRGRTTWSVDAEELIELQEILSVPLTKQTPLTPTQASKQGVPPDIIDAYAKHVPGKFKVDLDGGDTARKVFAKK